MMKVKANVYELIKFVHFYWLAM